MLGEDLGQGAGDFGYAYGEEARFRVAIFKQKGYCSLVLRKIPNKIMTFEQIGLPNWAQSDRYDIEAKGDPNSSRDETIRMIRALLKDRFGLKVHYEQRDHQVSAGAGRAGLVDVREELGAVRLQPLRLFDEARKPHDAF